MIWIIIMVPLMLLGVALAVVPLVWALLQDHRDELAA
jgi:hypothetical protein